MRERGLRRNYHLHVMMVMPKRMIRSQRNGVPLQTPSSMAGMA